MNKESSRPAILPAMCHHLYNVLPKKEDNAPTNSASQLKLITLYAPTSNKRAGNKSTSSKCMRCDATSLLNRFKDSLPVCRMPENLNWSRPIPRLTDATVLPTTIPPLMLLGSTGGHHNLRQCSLLAFPIRFSS
ncbi:hypothetical protein ACOSP7_004622 [Xanthoceras sorbifolium]